MRQRDDRSSPNSTTSSRPHRCFNDIFIQVTKANKVSGTKIMVRKVLECEVQEKKLHALQNIN